MIKYLPLQLIYSFFFVITFYTLCSGQTESDLEQMFRCSLRDKRGNLWFGTTGKGVYRFNAATDNFTHFTQHDGLSNNFVSTIIEDKVGNVWFGTAKGVCRYDGKSFIDITQNESVGNEDINTIMEDKNGNFWFGTNGWGVYLYDPSAEKTGKKSFTHFTSKDGLGSEAIQCILEDKSGNIWLGERAGSVSLFDAASNRFTKVNSDGCFSSQIMSMIEDKKGTFGSLIYMKDYADLIPNHEGLSISPLADGMCNNNVTCLYEDKKGNLWFGSDSGKSGAQGGGLCKYDGKSFIQFTTKDGLRNINVWSIVEDNEGNIWVGTKGGLFRYHAPSGKFVDYTHKLNN